MKRKKAFVLWGAGNAGEGFLTSIVGTYLAVYLTDVALIPVRLSSAVMLIGTTVVSILTFLSGGIIAMMKPMRWGRYRSWLIVGAPLVGLAYLFTISSVREKPIFSAVVITLAYIIAITGWNLVYAANASLTNVLAETGRHPRNVINSQRMIGSNLGRLMGNYLTPVLVIFFTQMLTERWSYTAVVLIGALFYIITQRIHADLCRGAEAEYLEQRKRTENSLTLKEIIRVLSSNAQLVITIIIDLTSNVAASALPALAVYYYRYVFERPDMVPIHMLLCGLAALAGSLAVRFLSKWVQDYRRFLLCAYIMVAALLLSTKLAAGNLVAFLVLNVVIRVVSGTTQPFELYLYQDNVVYSEWKTGVNANSVIMGFGEVPVRLTDIIKSVLISAALIAGGYVAGAEITPQLKSAISSVYAYIPALFPVLGFILLRFLYKLTPEKIQKMKQDISARAEKA